VKYIFLTFILLSAGFACSAQETSPAPIPSPDTSPARSVGVEKIYLARDDGNGNPGEQVKSFFTTDIPIHCVVELDSPKGVTVKMIFVAVDVPGVKADAKVVTTTYKTKGGEDQVNFTGKPYDKWHPGKYRVDIFLDDKLATNVPFDIRPASGSTEGATSFVSKPKPRAPIKPRQ